jgi:YjbE family integral membrane protein
MIPPVEFWVRWLGIVVIDLTLAGDNALVIALAVRALPAPQRLPAQMWGSLCAVILRVLLIAAVSLLLKIPLLQLAGGLLLVWIAAQLVRQETGAEGRLRRGATLLEAIWIIILADVAMSLDNVLAIAAVAAGNVALVVFGVSLSLPLVVWGSGILSRLMNTYPVIIWMGGGILGYASGEMILKDPLVHGWIGHAPTNTLHTALPLLLGSGIGILGWLVGRSRRRAGQRRA